MAWVFGGKKFGQYTYEHWFDDEDHEDPKIQDSVQEENKNNGTEKSEDSDKT